MNYNIGFYMYSLTEKILLFEFVGDRPAIVAPPESEWYHGMNINKIYIFTLENKLMKIDFLSGRLDRYSSEQRLRNTGKLGSYLVRESDRKPGSYVLSYLGRTGINHFRY